MSSPGRVGSTRTTKAGSASTLSCAATPPPAQPASRGTQATAAMRAVTLNRCTMTARRDRVINALILPRYRGFPRMSAKSGGLMSSGATTGWNYFKTALLMAALTGVLILLGGLIGGSTGLIVMVVIAVVFNFAMYWGSGKLALKMSRAVEVSPEEAPELHAMVDRLAARAGCPKPGVYVTPDQQPNAFACGRNPKHAA
ncbi:MAG: hypothetical protein FJW78_05845, partial [Actinobacteria bacterium]|nr:hypothetical protein [Actinomycetota bacterium]